MVKPPFEGGFFFENVFLIDYLPHMSDRINLLQQYLAESPDDCFLNHALALEYLKINELNQALACFEKNRKFDENYVGTYYHLAKLYEQLRERDKAIETYEKGLAIAKQSGDQHSYNELQSAYEDLIY